MGLFDWLFRKPPSPAPPGQKRYEYPTGNVELAMRAERGEHLMAVMADIRPRWAPGNEHLWDDYEPAFSVERKFMDNEFPVEYNLTIDGDKFNGKGAAELGGQKREWDIEGKREKKDK